MPIDAALAAACARQLRASWFTPPTFTGLGTIFDAADAEAARIHQRWDTLRRTQELVAEVLSDVASAQLDLDHAWQWARKFGDESETTTSFLNTLRAMGDALDAACASQIELICTPDAVPPRHRFADLDQLSIDAIHELNATPELEAIAGPDGRILEAGDGHLVITYGDLEHSRKVATIVAGVGSSQPETWVGYAGRGRRLAQEAGASVVWLGYRAPDSVPAALVTEPAIAGGVALREFQAALANRNPEQYRTIVAHSYGTVVAGNAARAGLDADALILLGSPGVAAEHASELKLHSEHPRVIAVTGERDPISFAAAAAGGVHGPDPTHPRFGAEVWDTPTDHGGYWGNQEFLRKVGALGG